MSSKIVDALFSPISLIVGDKVGHAITGAAMVVAGIATGNLQLVMAGAGLVAASFTPKPKQNSEAGKRLIASFVTTEARKLVLGATALPTDVRYQTYTGTDQEYLHQVFACAAHSVDAISEVWIDNEKAWSASGGVLGRFAGYLTVQTKLVGVSGAGFAIDGVWNAAASLTGCAQVYLKLKLTGTSSKASSPFSGGVSGRITIRGNGALLYDPRLDSTAGGSGAQRATDRTTWTFGSAGRNPALQLLWYLLGWTINGRLSVGMGLPAARIDMASFIAAANVCDETVALAAGGTELRYRSDGAFSEGDDRATVLSGLLASMNGTLRDNGGKIALVILKNDLAAPVASFTEADILGEETWEQTPSVDRIYTAVRGHYIDASDTALYQPVDFPEVAVSGGPVDGIHRIDTIDFSNVQSASQAQRLAKQRLQRSQYQGRYTAQFGARAWQVSLGDVVQFSHQGLGWTNKLFRVVSQSVAATGVTSMVLQEENAAIYSWSAEESAPVVPGTPTVYDPANSPILAGVAAATSTIYRQVSAPTAPIDNDVWVELVSPMRVWVRIGGSWQTAANYITQGTDIGVANGATKNTLYRSGTAPGSPIDGDVWVDTSVTPNVTRFRVSGAWQAGANLVTQGTDIGVANGATADITFYDPGGRYTASGNKLTKSGGAGWNGNAYSVQAIKGPCLVAGTLDTVEGFIALADNQGYGGGASEWTLLNYAWHRSIDGNWYIYLSGSLIFGGVSSGGLTFSSATMFSIADDEATIGFFASNGTTSVLVASTPTTAARTFCAAFALNSNGRTVSNLQFRPYTSNDLGTKAGTLPKVSNLPNLAAFGATYYFNGAITYSAAAGSPATATISAAAGSLVAGSFSLAYNAMSVGVTGTGGTSVTYGLYVSDASRAGGSQTLVATTSGQTLASSDGYIQIGACTVAFPASGTGGGGGTRGGGGGGIQP